MNWRILPYLFILFCVQFGYSQQQTLQFQLIDSETALPVADAHVFISDASIGAISDAQGRCEMQISPQETQELIITHVAYESLIVMPDNY
ncbi:MAG: hypothetical protein AB8G22_05735, partial [Saprospiraceae bacterium]